MGGVLLIVSYLSIFVDRYYEAMFTHNSYIDLLIGNMAGSISFGIPITSYIIGGELINEGVSLIAVTAFMVAWVTVGFIQFPAEAKILGKKFAIIRNLLSFIFSILIALATVFTLEVFL